MPSIAAEPKLAYLTNSRASRCCSPLEMVVDEAHDEPCSNRGKRRDEATIEYLSDAVTDRLSRIARFSNAPDVALCVLSKQNPIRLFLLRVVLDPTFDAIALLSIILNTAFLCVYDPLDEGNVSARELVRRLKTLQGFSTLLSSHAPGNIAVQNSEIIFTILFTVEMALKLAAFGVYGRGSYLGDPWNWIDALVVAIGWVTSTTTVGNVSALRVLRLIKSTAKLSGLRVTVSALVNSIPNTTATLLFGVIYLLLWALVGLEIWDGVIAGTCAYTNATGVVKLLNEQRCALSCDQFAGAECTRTYGDACPPLIAEFAEVESFCVRGSNPDSGKTSFDNVGSALFTSFIAVVAEGEPGLARVPCRELCRRPHAAASPHAGWVDPMYFLWEAWGLKPLVSILFTFHRFFGVYAIIQVSDGNGGWGGGWGGRQLDLCVLRCR